MSQKTAYAPTANVTGYQRPRRSFSPPRTSWHRRPFFDVKLLNAMYVHCGSSKYHIVNELREREDLQWRLRGSPLASRILENRRVGPCFCSQSGHKTGQSGRTTGPERNSVNQKWYIERN